MFRNLGFICIVQTLIMSTVAKSPNFGDSMPSIQFIMNTQRFVLIAATVALTGALFAAFALAKAGEFNVHTDGARAGKFDTYTDGARADKFETFPDGARAGGYMSSSSYGSPL